MFLSIFLLQCCENPEDNPRAFGELAFDQDSVVFDTLFTTVQSPTERLMIYNRASFSIKIASIEIEGGEQSVFKLIFDGKKGQLHQNYILAGKDSAYAFFFFF